MNPKQKAFCEEYLIDLNATQAAIRAGYSPKTAGTKGSGLLQIVKIRDEIDRLRAERSERTKVNADMVVNRLWLIVDADVRKLFDSNGELLHPKHIDDETASAIGAYETSEKGTKVRLNDRIKALELLGRHLGMFTERVEQTVSVGKVVIYLPDNGRDPQTPSDATNVECG